MTQKTCHEYRNQLEIAVSGDLETSEFQRLMNHLIECPQCQCYWQELQKDDHLLAEFSQSLKRTVSRIEDNVISSIQKETEKESQTILFWRWMMFSNWGRVSAILVLMFGGILAYSLIDRPGPAFTAWAEVLVNVQNAESFRYWEKDLVSGHEKMTIVGSNLGYYREIYQRGRLLLREHWEGSTNSIVFCDDAEKKYGRLFLSQEQLAEAQELAPQNLLARVLKYNHHELGEKIVNGHQAAGIEVRDASFEIAKWDRTEAELWVDVKTQLPIRFEMIGEAGHGKIQRHLVMEDFEWNPQINPADFDLKIPHDYELIVNIPEVVGDEKHTIEALRIYSGMTRGRFPSTLAMETALQEVKGSLRQGELRFRDLEDAWKIYSAGKFYQQLLREEKEPVYFGNRVRAGEGERVLLRWKIEEDRYRAIMGDLHVEEFSGSELLKAER